MSAAIDRILQSMHPLVIYRPEDVSAATGIDRQTCSQALNLLAKGGIVEKIDQGFRAGRHTKKVYQTKQKALPL